MNMFHSWLSSKILEFISVLNRCLSETTFAEDRHIYSLDIAAASAWLIRLQNGEEAVSIANEILQPATAKHFTDYWRQGMWGEIEGTALRVFQDEIKANLAKMNSSP